MRGLRRGCAPLPPRFLGRNGWEIMPADFAGLLIRMGRDYLGVAVFATENGAAFCDEPDGAGFVHKGGRIDYLASPSQRSPTRERPKRTSDTSSGRSSTTANGPTYGYDKRFRFVRLDYATQQCTRSRARTGTAAPSSVFAPSSQRTARQGRRALSGWDQATSCDSPAHAFAVI